MKNYELLLSGKMHPLQMREVENAVCMRYNKKCNLLVTHYQDTAPDLARMVFPQQIGKEKILVISGFVAGFFAARDVHVGMMIESR